MKVDKPQTQIQVFAGEFEDGRKKPRFYLLRGSDKEEALSEKYEATEGKPIPARQNSESCTLNHLGCWKHFEENAEEYSYDFYSKYSVPMELAEEVGHYSISQIKDRAKPDNSKTSTEGDDR